ncbi:hypothetical protein SORBI_3001G000501 [Sorghum bicolor]|uniref:Uncharacterized protein n=1 Tax=Sorghum bicolor TaxID=4558 RepID=A0A1Z5S3R5_SORBI|nr:hypothetical protein SORBI_3001G000501 [Sorghum bicolor]
MLDNTRSPHLTRCPGVWRRGHGHAGYLVPVASFTSWFLRLRSSAFCQVPAGEEQILAEQQG